VQAGQQPADPDPDRHEADVDELERGFESLDVLAQRMAHIPQLAADADPLLGEFDDRVSLVLGEDDLVTLAGAKLGKPRLGLLETLQELLLFLPEAKFRILAKLVDDGERAQEPAPAADADEIAAPRQVVEGVDDEAPVGRDGNRNALAEEVLPLHPELILQKVGIPDHAHVDLPPVEVFGSGFAGRPGTLRARIGSGPFSSSLAGVPTRALIRCGSVVRAVRG